ncbi:MAG TPA: ATP synthase F1 subunit delta [Fimbriimonadaceae bacterium]|jgi:F-type H+-transporting ATPase subunit delta
MQDHRVAKRYAKALFNEAQKSDMVAAVEADLNAISNLSTGEGQFKDFIFSPHVAREEKSKIAERLFSDRITALTMQFIRIVIEKRREAEIALIHEEYVNLRREHGNVIYAEVISAEALDDKQRDALEKKLKSLTGKHIEAAYDVDPKLVGGLKIVYGNYVLDGTVKGTLRRLEDKLKQDLFK